MSALRKRAILPIVLVAACLLAMVVVITQTYTVASRDNIHAIVKSNEAPRRTLPKPTIALLMPARSTTSMVAVENAPLLTTFLPSMLETISSEDRNNFDYALYMGFDVADPLFDNEKNLKTLKQKVENANVFKIIELFAFHKTKGRPVLVWNRLASAAYNDGCHYFYQVNDDLELVSHDWSRTLTERLKSNPVFPGLGVAGPQDTRRPRADLMTQAFVSRIHLHIFGYFYPPLFSNWWSDDWISMVYGEQHTFRADELLVSNTQSYGGPSRYEIARGDQDILQILVDNGKRMIGEFLEEHEPGATLSDEPRHKDQRSPHAIGD
ncbi:unnamed protein product (mitochondrion) [Plasmodiophora brassicae]|uniref:Uncharacterized protein n=1 Tax=Plasmodiophora brassicae TaxID=37360 RepID=A0A0G4J702_PLABS|nr:hypothetical protein PBRA_003115 [Plasmodiophora brassicae]SPQ95593.1 unnamed protein product [Plasmodiophora brassicae]